MVRSAAPAKGRPTVSSIIRLPDAFQVTQFGTALDLSEAKRDFTMPAGHTDITGGSHPDCETHIPVCSNLFVDAVFLQFGAPQGLTTPSCAEASFLGPSKQITSGSFCDRVTLATRHKLQRKTWNILVIT